MEYPMSSTAEAPSIEEQLRVFIVENFLFGDDSRTIEASSSLIENDFVDSTGILELVAFIEERFGFRMSDHEIAPDNLDSIERIVSYVRSKSGRSAPTCAA
jgi:acyl carrier protein